MNSIFTTTLRTTRSFVIREGRFSKAQRQALELLAPKYCIDINSNSLRFNDYFTQVQPVVMDIGFGTGESLLSIAQQRTDINFIGVEVYRQGIGSLLQRLDEHEITNVRVINADILEIMQNNILADSLAGMLVWFPDPWPKTKHRKRRLVQEYFLKHAIRIIKNEGVLHFASDWQPYVKAVRKVAKLQKELIAENVESNPLLELERPSTRFERRGLRLNHELSDLFYRVSK